ncbi:MAG TPA: ROK family protein [Ignavibacteriaceae bacterium]|nr:ROK family protein [Ignavibacteriaceae bacterium]
MPKANEYAIGVDLGGTCIKFGMVNQKGKIVEKTILPTKAEKGPKTVIKQIKKGIKELLQNKQYKVSGIGIGAPGVISTKKGTVENPPNFPGWGKIHLGSQVEKAFNIPVKVENDANAAAIGEMIFGSGTKLKSFIMITLGTGVGGGLIFNKKLFRGDSGGAGEIGHITIDYKGEPCNCGSIGCIEAYAGNNYFINRVKNKINEHPESKIWTLIDNDLDSLTPKIICEAANQHDEYAILLIINLGLLVGYSLANIVNVLDIPNVIVGGGVSGFGKLLFENIEKGIKERVLKSLVPKIKVYPAKLKNDAGVKGASALVFY